MRLDDVGHGEGDGVEEEYVAVLRCRRRGASGRGSAGGREGRRVGEVAVFRRGREGADGYGDIRRVNQQSTVMNRARDVPFELRLVSIS